jgi:hypothetical protein
MMRTLIRLEELSLVLLSVFLFRSLGYTWWWFPALVLAPDVGLLGYLGGPRVGALTYNLLHHKAVAVVAYVIGTIVSSPLLQLIGLIMLAHSSLDRVFGYGLKYPDSFKHTHLGTSA